MGSLRTQVIALVVGSVLMSLLVLGLHTSKVARIEFQTSVEALRITQGATNFAGLQAAYEAGGWDAVRAGVAELESALVISGDRIIAATDSSWLSRPVTQDSEGAFRLRLNEAGGRRAEMALVGGYGILDTNRDTVGRVFPLPRQSIVARIAPSGDVEAFSAAVSRRVWLGALALLLLATGAASWVSHRMLGPLRRLGRAAQEVGSGNYAARAGSSGPTEVREVAVAFDGMVANLERSEQMRARMIRDIAHELRTPLTILRGQIEALMDGLRTADGAALESLHEEVALLGRLVADLDELSRADSGQLQVHPQALNLADEVTRALDGFIQSGLMDREHIAVSVSPGLRVLADPERLAQILRNVLENAVRHGGDQVSVRVQGTRRSDGIRLEVADDGPGVEAEHLPHVFERLYRVDAARTRDSGGAGLGLAIVKEMMEAMGGAVAMASERGQGCTLTLDLPAAP